VYSNFADKPDLFVSVLERRLSQRAAEIADAMAVDGFVDQLRSGVGTRRSARELRRWLILHDEFRLYALRHPGAAKRLARHERHERDLYVRAIAFQLERRGVSLPADARLMAAIMFALDTSLPRQHLIDPEDVAETAYGDAVALLLRAAIALDAAGR
jgi:AcrR family transcriptional regulator